MAQLKQLLEYQQVDSEMLKIEQETAVSEERKNYVQAKKFLEKAAEKLDALDAKAREINVQINELNGKYAEISETLNEFDNVDELLEGGADISFYKKNVLQLLDMLRALKSEINALTKSAKDADEEYKSLKKKTLTVQDQYNKEFSVKYKAFVESKKKEMAEVAKKLEELAKNLDPEVLKKYKIKRSERIFPILCPVKSGRCSKCGNELSLSGKDKIESGSVIECDGCRRFLFKE